MEATKKLKNRVLIETISLILLLACILYAIYSISIKSSNKIGSNNNFVTVIDDKKYNENLVPLSDGEGVSQEGIIYSVTNNNKGEKEYSILIKPSENEKDLKISIDDIVVKRINELEKDGSYYVLGTYKLKGGYTKRHEIKSWLDIDSKQNISVTYEIKIKTN